MKVTPPKKKNTEETEVLPLTLLTEKDKFKQKGYPKAPLLEKEYEAQKKKKKINSKVGT